MVGLKVMLHIFLLLRYLQHRYPLELDLLGHYHNSDDGYDNSPKSDATVSTSWQTQEEARGAHHPL